MKLSKDELKQKISDNIKDNDDLVIELLEDIEDSFVTSDEPDTAEIDSLKAELEESKANYKSLQEKYKQRFLSKDEKEDDEDEKEDDEEEKDEVIDIKEI